MCTSVEFFFAYLLHYLNESTYFVYMCVCGKWLVFVKQHFPFFSRNNWIIGSNLSFSNAYYDKELLLSNIKLARSWKQISTFFLFLGEKLLQKPFFLQMCFIFLWCYGYHLYIQYIHEVVQCFGNIYRVAHWL